MHNEMSNYMNNIKNKDSKVTYILTTISLLQRGGVGIPIDFISHPAFYRLAR